MRIISLGVHSAFATGKYEVVLPAGKLESLISNLEESPENDKNYIFDHLKKFISQNKSIYYNPKWQANFLIEFDCPNKRDGHSPYRLVLDFGGDIRHSLKALGLALKDIDGYYVSHPHADHIGGVEAIALTTFFNPFYTKQKAEWLDGEFIADRIVTQKGEYRYKVPSFAKPDLYGHKDVLQELWQAAMPGLKTLQGVREVGLDTYFNVISLIPNQAFVFPDGVRKWEIYTMLAVHIVAGDDIMPSYGLILESEDKTILMPTDTQIMTTPQLKTHYRRADVVYQDCETSPFPSGVHPHINDLKKLAPEYKKKMLLYHYDEEPIIEPGEFLGILKTGESREY